MSGRSRAGAGRAGGGTGSSAAGGSGAGGGGSAPGSWITRPPKAPKPGRLVAYLALVILGAIVGTAGSLVQAAWMPGGLVLALLASAGLFIGSLRATGSQLGVACSAVGWLAAIVLLSTGRPEGDAMFGAGIGPLVFMLGGMAVAVMCATMSRASQPGGGPGRLGG
ncbi:DUF6113 family protein [Streptomyces pristinaespiralis]|uniref:DUF6113 family protein n=1 Tax=Streptomyces pristinaespiralis TaxID=38300 RepID=UPI003833A659